MEFPIGKKLIHFGLKPRYVAVPDRGPGSGKWNWLIEHDIPFGNSNRENGPTFLDFPLFLGIFQWNEPTKRVPFTAEPEIPEILTKWQAPLVPGGFWERETNPLQFRHDNRQQVGGKCYILCRICGQDRAIYGLSHGLYHWKGLFLVLWHF